MTAAALILGAAASAVLATPQPARISLRDGVFRIQPAAAEATLEVYVDGPADLPPLLGAISREGDVLLFKPRFALEPGLRYRAVYRDRPGSAPLIEVVSVPAEASRPPTRLDRVDPTGDLLPENLLKLYLSFTASMSRGEAYRRIRLLDEGGRAVELPFLEIDQELWDREGRRLTLLFDPGRVKRDLVPNVEEGRPLRAGHSYTLVVEAGWPDTRGNPLASETRKAFRVGPPDYDPPKVSDWRLAPPRAGTLEPLVVTFPDPLDRALLERVLEVFGPSGEPVPGSISIDTNETRWSLKPKNPWKPGDHELRAPSILEDLAGNSLGRRFEVDTSTTTDSRPPRVLEVVPFTIKD